MNEDNPRATPEKEVTSDAGSPAAPRRTLADVLMERGPLSEAQFVAVFRGVLADLEKAHSQGMLHRDITTARVVYDGMALRLVDYGASKIGSVRYMSPERCQRKPTDARSDIYSLGIVMYEAVTGRLPFDEDLNYKVIDCQVNKPPPPPRSVKPDVSPELERLILRALAKNPATRFQTAAAFREALEELGRTSQASVAESEAGLDMSAAPGTRSARKRLRAATWLAPLVVVVITGALLLLSRGNAAVSVPRALGKSESDAREMIRKARLKPVFDEPIDDTMAEAFVASQLPVAGERVKKGTEVRLSLSTGKVAVPAVIGLGLADAQSKLRGSALDIASVDSTFSDRYPAGTITKADPIPGSRINSRAKVRLTVAAGKATCPDCGARREAGARFCVRCGYKF